VQAARVRARRRLIGAVVLLGLGIIGFPLVFETAPRSLPLDIPIEVARQDGAAPRSAVPPPALPVLPHGAGGMITELPADAGTEVPPPALPASASAAMPAASMAAPAAAAASAVARAASSAAPRASQPAAPRADDGQRARALLEGSVPAKPAASEAQAGRFVVQVGAYTDTAALREARQKVEKLGMKTYTQVVDTETGQRTRVRVGPFATRDEAAAAGRTLKAAGLPANILAL
jgi:DedD protein